MKHPAIKENHLYGKVYAKGKCVRGRYTAVYVLRDLAYGKLLKKDPHRKSFNRVGLTVTKTIGNAVVRSRVRRILRAGLRAAETRKMTEGKLIVICARSAAATAKSYDIARELTAHFETLGLYLSVSQKGSVGGTPSASAAGTPAASARRARPSAEGGSGAGDTASKPAGGKHEPDSKPASDTPDPTRA